MVLFYKVDQWNWTSLAWNLKSNQSEIIELVEPISMSSICIHKLV